MYEQQAAAAMAGVRIANSPEPGSLGAKPTRCERCGNEFWQWQRQHKRSCPICSGLLSVEVTESMRNKSGKAYEHWLQRQLDWVTGEAKRLGLQPTDGPPERGD